MAPAWSAHVPVSSPIWIALLCFVLVMQMLGAATSFWTLTFSSDPLGAPLLEGFSLPPTGITLIMVVSLLFLHDTAVRLPSILLDDILLRPPSPARHPSAVPL